MRSQFPHGVRQATINQTLFKSTRLKELTVKTGVFVAEYFQLREKSAFVTLGAGCTATAKPQLRVKHGEGGPRRKVIGQP
ncbi:MAG TPA: hypothetical protein VGB70_07180 [Allosphingosinicella sp.]|jgi:hypothetical protein